MKENQHTIRWLSPILRPAFGLLLFLSQFAASRSAVFTQNIVLIVAGILLIAGSIGLWISASSVLSQAVKKQKMKFICHPPIR